MNEEKDRYGDFMQLVERAREDLYFAARDRELLGKLKEDLLPGEQATLALAAPLLKCPQCGTALQKASVADVTVKRCNDCRGVWLDRSMLPKFLNNIKAEPDSKHVWSRHSLRYIWPNKDYTLRD